MEYNFWGWKNTNCNAVIKEYVGIITPLDLYDALTQVWSRETCTPRLRGEWSEENRTCGQCAITAFLAQDIFGGKVYGIPIGDGNFHCYNVIGDSRFDLTSEQFKGQSLVYDDRYEQLREKHFAREEKRLRYEALKAGLSRYCDSRM